MGHDRSLVVADGTEIRWSETGAGDPVILVHGITESAESWLPVAQRLAAGHRVISLDLRGHGQSAKAPRHDLETMVGDVIAVASAAGASKPHLVGHSLGGAVVSAVGAAVPVQSVVSVDQTLRLDTFKEQLEAVEPALRDPESFPHVIHQMFLELLDPAVSDAERERLTANRRPDQDVVLGIWGLLFAQSAAEIGQTVDAVLAGYASSPTPYLALFGIDPSSDYETWLIQRIPGATVELWPDHGHYPHLVDPDRFIARLHAFWAYDLSG
jgi:pimeloyl-ACP methyl ester carboxylesterase